MSKRDYYEILGVKRNAKLNDIGLAYNRLMSAAKRDDVMPDLKYETRLREARMSIFRSLDQRRKQALEAREHVMAQARESAHKMVAQAKAERDQTANQEVRAQRALGLSHRHAPDLPCGAEQPVPAARLGRRRSARTARVC